MKLLKEASLNELKLTLTFDKSNDGLELAKHFKLNHLIKYINQYVNLYITIITK